MTEQRRFNFNIFFLIYVVMWKMLQTFFLSGFDTAGRITILLMIFAFIINAKHFLVSSRGMLIWCVWIIYVIICSKEKGFYDPDASFSIWTPHRLILPFLSMLVAYEAISFDYQRTLMYLYYTYVVFVILGLFNMNTSERDITRQNNQLGNYFFNNAIFLASYVSIFFSQGKIKNVIFYMMILLVLYTIFISGERKGLICVFIIVFGSLYAKNQGKGVKTIVYMLVLAVLAYVAINLAMNYSVAAARMQDDMMNSNYADNVFLKMMGNRAIMYSEGWPMFLDNFWTGIGITNYRWQNSFFYGLPFHTEYMVQLTECGIIGTLIYLIFNFNMVSKLCSYYKLSVDKTAALILASTILSIYVMNFVTWTYSYSGYFIFYGIIFGLNNCKMRNIENINTNSTIQ